jgi:putative tricarboxylic transport membrane protein
MVRGASTVRGGVAVTAIAALVFGGLYLLGALQYSRGSLAHPGPGTFPLVIAVVLLLGAAGTALEAFFGRDGEPIAWPRGWAAVRVVSLAAATGAYAVLLPLVGHPLSGGLLTFIALTIMGLRPWWRALVLAIVLTAVSHYLFTVLLGVPLPAGRWIEW